MENFPQTNKMHPLKMHNHPIQTLIEVIWANMHYVVEMVTIWTIIAIFEVFGVHVDPHAIIVALMPYMDFLAKALAVIASIHTVYKIRTDLKKK